MLNTIQLAKNYTDLLDKVYMNASVTAALTGDPKMVRAGTNVNEIVYPQISMTGLGDYDRNSGYTDGQVNLEWKTTTFNYDRGTKFVVDTMDDEETFDLAFGALGAEFQRTKVAPEADAFCFAQIAGTSGISIKAESIADAAAFMKSLLEATNVMDNDQVPENERYLYATPTLLNSILIMDTYKSKEVLSKFAVHQKVPQNRFYTDIDLLDGKTAGEELGHYKKSDTAKEINFMIIHKPALIKYDKHTASDVIPPALNTDSDGYLSKYRKYGIVDVYDHKKAGIYLSHKA